MRISSWLVLVVSCWIASVQAQTIKLNGPKECPTRDVVVYNDRAEVTRLVDVEVPEAGDYTIAIQGLSAHINDASVHVGAGVGDATILEVSTKFTLNLPVTDRTRDVKNQENKLAKAKAEMARVQRALELLDDWAEAATRAQQTSLEIIDTLIDTHYRKKAELDEKLATVQEVIYELERKINEVFDTTSHKDIILTIRANKPGQINLLVSYVVHQVEWTPDYDIRVESDTAEAQVIYYGTVINHSNEEWTNVSVALSTAMPSVDGNPPDLRTLNVVALDQHLHYYRAGPQSRKLHRDSAPSSVAFEKVANFGFADASEAPKVSHMTSQAIEGVSATSFNIPRRANIHADGQPHKVTVGTFDFKCNFSYSIIPKLSSNAFLKANLSNESEFPLLGGQVRVFLDNTFVAHSNIKHVSVGDFFEVYLGVDKAIKVERKPDKLIEEIIGFISKSNQKTYRHSTFVKNNKKLSIPIVVYEQIPVSSTENIKVTVLQPMLAQENPEAVLNSNNIIEWHATLAPKEQTTFVAEYKIEYPVAQIIQFA